CLIERDYFLGVQWEELVHVRWTKMNQETDDYGDDEGGVEKLIDRFNLVSRVILCLVRRKFIQGIVVDQYYCVFFFFFFFFFFFWNRRVNGLHPRLSARKSSRIEPRSLKNSSG